MIKFEKVSKYKDIEFDMPSRKTANSAGYDMVIAEDIIIPSYQKIWDKVSFYDMTVSLDELAAITKQNKIKPTLVPTGVKCYLEPGYYLELSVRSSTPLKYWLILANSVGIIDADYADNPDNEGHIYFQIINLSPVDIQLRKGDIIGQGIIKKYEITDNDNAVGERMGGFGSTSNSIDYTLPNATPDMLGSNSAMPNAISDKPIEINLYQDSIAKNYTINKDEFVTKLSDSLAQKFNNFKPR